MINDIGKQPQLKSIPAFNVNYKIRLNELDLNEIVQKAGLLSQYMNRNIRLKVSLIEKELYVMANTARMEEVITNLSKNSSDAISDDGTITYPMRVPAFLRRYRSREGIVLIQDMQR